MFRSRLSLLVLTLAAVSALPLLAQDSTATAAAPDATTQLVGLWAAGLALVTALLTQGLKKVATPIGAGPDWMKAGAAFVVAFATTKLAAIFHAPIPGDLHGFAAVVVNWCAAMGLHAVAKKTGLVTDARTGLAIALLAASAVGASSCATRVDGAPGKPALEVLAATGDTAKLFVSWVAVSGKATGAQLTALVTATNGTWTALPTAAPVTPSGTMTLIVTSATADSALFQVCMRATAGPNISPTQGCSGTRQWRRVLLPPIVNIDSLLGLIVGPSTMTLTGIGTTGQLCAYYKFTSGHVAMRAGDALGCQVDYGTRFSVFEKAVTNTEQVWADGRCQKWTSSNPAVATVTSEPGCTGLGLLWMDGVPLAALRAT